VLQYLHLNGYYFIYRKVRKTHEIIQLLWTVLFAVELEKNHEIIQMMYYFICRRVRNVRKSNITYLFLDRRFWIKKKLSTTIGTDIRRVRNVRKSNITYLSFDKRF
jgi:hypothetical protein